MANSDDAMDPFAKGCTTCRSTQIRAGVGLGNCTKGIHTAQTSICNSVSRNVFYHRSEVHHNNERRMHGLRFSGTQTTSFTLNIQAQACTLPNAADFGVIDACHDRASSETFSLTVATRAFCDCVRWCLLKVCHRSTHPKEVPSVDFATTRNTGEYRLHCADVPICKPPRVPFDLSSAV